MPEFGRYRAVEQVGEGSLGTVFRAEHTELGRVAAVKMLREEVRHSSRAVASLRSEAQVLAGLDHPNVVAFYDFVEEPDRAWLAEQWVDGAPLTEILDQHGQLTPEQALGVLAGALSGLAHAHERDVVHRDVSAGNVLADMAGTSMLLDFGIAAPVQGADLPGVAAVLGTPAYLSPEAARGAPVGKSSDVYSAAALAYHLLSGYPVFTGTAWDLVTAHRDQTAPALEGHGPRLADLIARALSKDPDRRPPDAAAFLAELGEAATERYGADWRSRSSIAALVLATGGAAAGIATGLGTVEGAATVLVPETSGLVTGVAGATVRTGRATRRLSGKVLLAAGAATVAVVAAGTFVLTQENNKSEAETSALSAEEKQRQERQERREEKIEQLESTVPSGAYDFRTTAISTRRNGETVEEHVEGTWVFKPGDCNANRCHGSVGTRPLNPDVTLDFTWDGSTLAFQRDPRVETIPREACVDVVTEEVQPIEESSSIQTYTYKYHRTQYASPLKRSPRKLAVYRTARYSYQFLGTCESSPDDFVRTDTEWKLTKKK